MCIRDRRLCDMKQQSVKLEDNISKRLNEMDECFNTFREQVIGSVNEQFNNHIINVNKQVSETGDIWSANSCPLSLIHI